MMYIIATKLTISSAGGSIIRTPAYEILCIILSLPPVDIMDKIIFEGIHQ